MLINALIKIGNRKNKTEAVHVYSENYMKATWQNIVIKLKEMFGMGIWCSNQHTDVYSKLPCLPVQVNDQLKHFE